MNNQQEKLILESLFLIFGLLKINHPYDYEMVCKQKSKINDRLVEIQKEEEKEKR